MNKFISALTTNDARTENDMVTHSTSGSTLVDLFFKMGASRTMSEGELLGLFANSFGEEDLLTLKAAFYNRDIRGGQGERRSFRIFFQYLCHKYPAVALNNLDNVVKFGRWDDLLVALETPIGREVASYIGHAIVTGNKLASKWMPREGKRGDANAKILMRHLGLEPKHYRKLLAHNTEVVESLMCSKEWGKINYSHVPSKASHKYRNAFLRNDTERYSGWLEELKKPVEERAKDVKVNAGAIFPHDILAPLFNNFSFHMNVAKESSFIDSQWAALPDYMPKGRSIIPVCDVSGSMFGFGPPMPIVVSVALGLYLSERNEGPFKDHFITFSSSPALVKTSGKTISDKALALSKAKWGMTTDLEAVFRLILNKAIEARLSNADMPETILLLSDMQFNQCVRKNDDSAMKMIERMYAEAGYTRPQVVFWNLRTGEGVPVKFDKHGTALVSGFSPSILKSIFSGEELTPMNVVMAALTNPRYDSVTL